MVNKPNDAKLYAKVKAEAKKRFDVWPSAYASGWLVKEYKRQFAQKHGSSKNPYAGGTARRNKTRKSGRENGGSLSRWFQEDWRNVCEKNSRGQYKPCGRQRSSGGKYPYCRPRKRISSATPKTIDEMSSAEISRMCRRKRQVESRPSSRATEQKGRAPRRVYSTKRGRAGANIKLLNKLVDDGMKPTEALKVASRLVK
jgi:hypothetical protein